MQLTKLERDYYQQHGYVVRASQFCADEVAALVRATDAVIEQALKISKTGKTYHLDGNRFVDADKTTVQFEHSSDSTTVRVIEPAHIHDARIDALIDDARLAQPMQELVGAVDLALWTVKLNTKPAHEGSGFGWHQDSPYWVHDCNHVDQLPNVMLTLDEQTIDNGCFAIIPGSHKDGVLVGTTNGRQLGGFFTDPNLFDEQSAHTMTVPVGSLIFFSPHVIHGSAPNHSDQRRRALIFTYQPGDNPTLKRGDVRNVTAQV